MTQSRQPVSDAEIEAKRREIMDDLAVRFPPKDLRTLKASEDALAKALRQHQDQVRARADELWESADRPSGDRHEFLLAAEQELSPDPKLSPPADHQTVLTRFSAATASVFQSVAREMTDASKARGVETRVPARLDALVWGRFHTLVIVALGITWILDGLEVTFAGLISGALKADRSLQFTDTQIGLANSFYLVGAVIGALGFGWATDRLGRRVLFFVTLGLYLVATAATAFSWDLWSFCLFRFLTGAGIGGEYSAVNSTIQEFIPARFRGRTDLAINGSFWIGGGIGAAASLVFLDASVISADYGWRTVFFVGSAVSIGIIFLRTFIPESPRWLVFHGREDEAETVMRGIERRIKDRGGEVPASENLKPMTICARERMPISTVFRMLFIENRRRAMVGLTLMAAQAFFYNAIFFTFAQVLGTYYHVEVKDTGWYMLPFAIGNALGPLILGPFFDKIGRKPMIAGTYAISGVLLIVSGWLFAAGYLSATQQVVAWSVIFFFASSAAGAAYLTVGEVFPVEIRALAIAIFYAFGTGIGGVIGPVAFGWLIGTHDRWMLFQGYAFAAVLMLVAAVMQLVWGVAAECKTLEEISEPTLARGTACAS